jgi:hypothetical protein
LASLSVQNWGFRADNCPYSSDVTKGGTTQRDALIWLAEVDGPLHSALDSTIDELLQIYYLAVLYGSLMEVV